MLGGLFGNTNRDEGEARRAQQAAGRAQARQQSDLVRAGRAGELILQPGEVLNVGPMSIDNRGQTSFGVTSPEINGEVFAVTDNTMSDTYRWLVRVIENMVDGVTVKEIRLDPLRPDKDPSKRKLHYKIECDGKEYRFNSRHFKDRGIFATTPRKEQEDFDKLIKRIEKKCIGPEPILTDLMVGMEKKERTTEEINEMIEKANKKKTSGYTDITGMSGMPSRFMASARTMFLPELEETKYD